MACLQRLQTLKIIEKSLLNIRDCSGIFLSPHGGVVFLICTLQAFWAAQMSKPGEWQRAGVHVQRPSSVFQRHSAQGLRTGTSLNSSSRLSTVWNCLHDINLPNLFSLRKYFTLSLSGLCGAAMLVRTMLLSPV
jgi:hypothetical protein